MSDNKIYYFSGTGNCLASAKQLAKELGGADVIPITAELVEKRPVIECEKCILIFPAYAYGLPSLVHSFLKKSVFRLKYCAALVTCGTRIGGALAAAKRLLKKKGQKLHFGMSVKAVENYVHIFGLAKQPALDARIAVQESETLAAAILINKVFENKIFSFRPISAVINAAFRFVRPVFAKTYKVTEECNGCGLCCSICPSAAINLTFEKRPEFNGKKCDHCQGCMHWCPQKAIKFLRVTPKSRRYRHPDVTAAEMKKR